MRPSRRGLGLSLSWAALTSCGVRPAPQRVLLRLHGSFPSPPGLSDRRPWGSEKGRRQFTRVCDVAILGRKLFFKRKVFFKKNMVSI